MTSVKNILRFTQNNKLPVFLVLFFVLCCLMKNSESAQTVKDTFENLVKKTSESKEQGPAPSVNTKGPGPSVNTKGPAPVPLLSKVKPNDEEDMEYGLVGEKQKINLPTCAQFVSSNLLPKDDPKLDASFTEFSPAKDLEGQNFIDTNKYAIGMQSQTLRNANHQLRSDPPITNTMKCSSPWNNTTIDKEARRPLSIGSA